MATRLVPLNPGSAPPISVQRPVVLVGRHPECDVRIDLPRISRRHCCLALVYDRVLIRDLGSRNGLRVNGRLVDEAQLNPGDEVAIGPLIFRVEDPDALALPALMVPSRSATPQSQTQPPPSATPALLAPEGKPSSLPFLPLDPHDPDGDLLPIDL
jgi:pSer/pThr/pTyr-binding forkhead associated (FHA) protein